MYKTSLSTLCDAGDAVSLQELAILLGSLRGTLPEIKMFSIFFKREVKSRHPAHFSIFKNTPPEYV